MSKPEAIGELIGRGNVAEVFAFGDHVLKLYRPGADPAVALGEALAMAVAAGHGLPVPQVFSVAEHGGRWGVEMARAAGVPLAQVVEGQPGLVAGALEAMIALHAQMHETAEARLPALKPRLAERIARAPGLDAGQRGALLVRLAELPDGARLCHGDFHPFNLVGAPPRPTIIDWADATSGPAAADACRSYLILLPVVPELAEAYLEGYAARSGIDRVAVLDWLPVLAAARLDEGLADQEAFLRRLVGS
jgi:Ser/Thr protein kinase RdoA (MazF antagonist)